MSPAENEELEPSSAEEEEHSEPEEQEHDENEEEEEGELEEGENLMDGLPDYIVERVDKLRLLDQKRQAQLQEYLKERAALEQKFAATFNTLYGERAQIINGENEEAKKGDQAKGIPQFWVIAMGHMETIGSLLEPEDIECLEYLSDIACTDYLDGKGFTLKFSFQPNPYFENTELIKEYEVLNLLLDDEPVLKNVKGCTIQWKPNKCLTYKTVTKKQKGKGKKAGQVRTVSKKERQESFFHWFEPPQMPNLEDMNEDEAQKLEELFETDFDVAQSFRQQIIPKAVQWFTGEIAQQDLDSAVNAIIDGKK